MEALHTLPWAGNEVSVKQHETGEVYKTYPSYLKVIFQKKKVQGVPQNQL